VGTTREKGFGIKKDCGRSSVFDVTRFCCGNVIVELPSESVSAQYTRVSCLKSIAPTLQHLLVHISCWDVLNHFFLTDATMANAQTVVQPEAVLYVHSVLGPSTYTSIIMGVTAEKGLVWLPVRGGLLAGQLEKQGAGNGTGTGAGAGPEHTE